MNAAAPPGSRPAKNPWEQRETAVSSGLDPDSVTGRSARRRVGDAGLGRAVVVPIYLRRRASDGLLSRVLGVLVRLSPGGGIAVNWGLLPTDLGDESAFWLAIHRAVSDPDAVATREGWVRVLLGLDVEPPPAVGSIVLRDTDWGLLRAALTLRYRDPSQPQDAPVERVAARYLGRLDGLDGTAAADLWGRLALQVVTLRRPERLADSRSLRWHASWGAGGRSAGSGGRASGSAGHDLLLDLTQHRFGMEDRVFRVRTLPDWEREQAAYDLGLSPRQLIAWPVSPLAAVVRLFDDIAPAPLPAQGPQDGSSSPRSGRRPEDAPSSPPTSRRSEDAPSSPPSGPGPQDAH